MTTDAFVTCPSCGEANRAGARFCDSCGSPLTVAEPPRESRKVVTASFCDVTGSTALGEQLARTAVEKVFEKVFETDFSSEQAVAKCQLARVMAASDRRGEAASEAREALAIHESKGNQPGAPSARAFLLVLDDQAQACGSSS